MMSPHLALPTSPTPFASSISPTLRGWVKWSSTFSLYCIEKTPIFEVFILFRLAPQRHAILNSLQKSGLRLGFAPLPAPLRRDLVRRAGERGLSKKVSPELFSYLRGTESPLEHYACSSEAAV